MAKTILICDDAQFMRIILRDLLQREGYNVVGEAEDGKDAVLKYNQLQPDLVIMDITMPIMNRLDAIKVILEINPSASIIVCSALGQQEIVVDAIRSGAKDFIVKPFEDPQVITAIRKLIG